MTRRLLEIESLAQFDEHIEGARSLRGWVVSSIDMTGRSDRLLGVPARGAVFLGTRLEAETEERLRRAGALIFPQLPELPFDPYRPRTYTPEDLYGGVPYAASPDAAIYSWARSSEAKALTGTLAAALHDHSIRETLDDVLASRPASQVVGVMGGHALARDDPAYAAAAQLGSRLAGSGRLVLTGGGPGAMEAANLGARLGHQAAALPDALAALAAVPRYDDIDAWADAARGVLRRWPGDDGAIRSLSIPTWFYGHEPSNLFADGTAKFFANALREDTLLHRCRGGIVYLPGAAGTVQEIFQAMTENYYAASAPLRAPLVLVDVDYWNAHLPAWPLLRTLATQRGLQQLVHCVASIDEAAQIILDTPPTERRPPG